MEPLMFLGQMSDGCQCDGFLVAIFTATDQDADLKPKDGKNERLFLAGHRSDAILIPSRTMMLQFPLNSTSIAGGSSQRTHGYRVIKLRTRFLSRSCMV